MPRAMRLVRRCSCRQVSVTSSQVTAGASGFSPATRARAAPMEIGFSGVPGSAMNVKLPMLSLGGREPSDAH